MNVNQMIKRLGGKLYTVTRVASVGSYSTVDGTYLGGGTVSIDILASVQPLKAQEILAIPEGDRTRERFRFYSEPVLKLVDPSKLTKGDRVDIDGVAFEVESIEHWPGYAKSILVRVNTNDN